jgi:hypothetical protein
MKADAYLLRMMLTIMSVAHTAVIEEDSSNLQGGPVAAKVETVDADDGAAAAAATAAAAAAAADGKKEDGDVEVVAAATKRGPAAPDGGTLKVCRGEERRKVDVHRDIHRSR